MSRERLSDEQANLFRQVLIRELHLAKQRRKSTSLRAFSKKLNLGSGEMSEFLQSKRTFSKQKIANVLEHLNISSTEKMKILGRAEPKKILAWDQYQVLSDWRCIAALNCLSRTQWISMDDLGQWLNLNKRSCKLILDRLQAAGMAEKQGENYRRIIPPFQTTNDLQNMAIQEFHIGLLQKAQEAITQIPQHQREVGAVVFRFDPNKLDQLKNKFRQFLDQFESDVSTSENGEVYSLSMQLIPLTRQEGL